MRPYAIIDILNLQKRMINVPTQELEGTDEYAFEVFVERIKTVPNCWANKDRSANHVFACGLNSGFRPGSAAPSHGAPLEWRSA
jgi:hypothetical protein